jgi:hypothetical protein
MMIKKNKISYVLIVIVGLMSFNLANSQCEEDPKSVEMKNKLYDVRFSKDGSYEGYDLCRKYYYYKCLSELDTYEDNGNKLPRKEYDAKKIDDVVNRIIDDYNRLGNKKCGELLPVNSKYSDSISDRKDQVVGYWVSKDNVGGQINYTDFYFGNNQAFKMSLYPYKMQKAKWEKTGDYTYAITFQSYSDFRENWNDAEYSTFTINPTAGTAVYSVKDYNGNNKTSTWYFKGRAFNIYGQNEAEILKPKACKL